MTMIERSCCTRLLRSLILAGFGALAAPAAHAVTEMIITSELAPTHWKTKQMDALAADIAKRSAGRIKPTLFHSAQLFDDKGAINAMGTGSVHMAWPASLWLEAIEPRYGVANLLFGLRDQDMQNAAVREPLKDFLSSLIEKKGMRVLALYRTTEIAMMSNRPPLTSTSDFRGMKVRIPGGAVMREFSKLLGLNSVTMPASEIVPGMLQGVIDGAITSPGVWQQFGPKVSVTRIPDMLIAHYSVVVDRAWLDKLEARDRDAILGAVASLNERQWREAIAADQGTIDEMVKKGGKYGTLPEPALAELRKFAEKANGEFIGKYPEEYKRFSAIMKGQK